MMRLRIMALLLAGGALLLTARVASAQVPYIQVYFDSNLRQTSLYGCNQGALDTLYVVAHNFDAEIGSAEYAISYTVALNWICDTLPPDALATGNSPQGIVITYPTPLPAYSGVVLQEVLVSWNCFYDCQFNEYDLVVIPNPTTGRLGGVRASDSAFIDAVGMTDPMCGIVLPVHPTSWGAIKSLYK